MLKWLAALIAILTAIYEAENHKHRHVRFQVPDKNRKAPVPATK